MVLGYQQASYGLNGMSRNGPFDFRNIQGRFNNGVSSLKFGVQSFLPVASATSTVQSTQFSGYKFTDVNRYLMQQGTIAPMVAYTALEDSGAAPPTYTTDTAVPPADSGGASGAPLAAVPPPQIPTTTGGYNPQLIPITPQYIPGQLPPPGATAPIFPQLYGSNIIPPGAMAPQIG